MQKSRKKGAIELSIGTIVIIVLGLVLVRTIFTGATGNVDQMNDKVKDEINKLFVEDKKTVVYLPNQIARIKQNEDWGVAFAIKNLAKGTAESSSFMYDVVVFDPDIRTKCGVGERDIEAWIQTGKSETVQVAPGDTLYRIVRFIIPEGAPLCTVRFNIVAKRDNTHYATDFFDVEVLAK